MYHGTGVSPGIGLAQARIWQNPVMFDYVPRKSAHPSNELARFETAREELLRNTIELRDRTALRFSRDEAAIFDAYHLILNDEDGLLAPLRESILKENFSAEYAVVSQFKSLIRRFSRLEDEYFRQRAEDLIALRDQLLTTLEGHIRADLSHFDRPTIVVAGILSPADVANLDLSRLEGIICESGSYSSHMSIISRTLGIPAVVGAAGILQAVREGDLLALDGETGDIWVEPGKKDIRMLHHRGDEFARRRAAIQTYRGRPTISTDGRRVELSANVGKLDEVGAALAADAEAIGLYRTELLYLAHPELPTEEQQFEDYRAMLEKIGGKAATVRTFDDGGNKPTLPFKNRAEANPVLGYRGIRMSLGRPSFFRTQLRALLRASAYGSLKVMFPMLSNMDELDDALNALEQIKKELRRERIPFDEKMPVGVNIEVPSAALLSEAIAPKVDFLSIGINDLIQFTLAIDRSNPDLAYLYHQYHPAVLRLVRYTVQAAHKNHIPCTLCGEAPGQETVLPLMLGIGVDGFSTSPNLVLAARRILNNCSYAECQALADEVLAMNSSAEVEQRLSRALPKP